MSFVLACAFLAATAAPARADITAFLGLTPTPERHTLKGFAVGAGLIIVGWEFEFAHIGEDINEGLPGLKTYSGNFLVQTPTSTQLYATTGVEAYRENLGTIQETYFGTNIGGGVKIDLAGPLRVRIDYRIFRLGEGLSFLPSQEFDEARTAQRFYVGANLNF